MTEDDKQELAAVLAAELEDSAYGIATDADRMKTALLMTDATGSWFRQAGWLPPETSSRITDWILRTGNIPDHHLNRSVLTAHLSELAGIVGRD